MKSFHVLLGLAGLSVVVATVSLNSLPRVNNLPILPGAVIVELAPGASLGSKRDADPHADFFDELDKRGIQFETRRQFSSSLFTGASIQLQNPSDVVHLTGTSGVVAVRPVVLYPPPRIMSKVIPTGPTDPAVPPDVFSTHVMTGVDKLHAAGLFGLGIKIGILDTGTDYTNPVLGGGFGPGFKVAGTDFVGDAFNGTNTPMPDPDPLDQCNGHGTHVAGIIGANPVNEFNIVGVVPQATIFSYRVFGCSGTVPDDVLVEALLRGVSDGMDILTMSLGGSDGWTESTTSVLSSRIADMGKVVTIAAGNDGADGAFFTSSPGNGIDAISAASVDNVITTVQSVTTNVAHAPIAYFELFPLAVGGTPFPIFVISQDTTVVDDACNPLAASTPDLSKVVTVVRRGTCTVQKLTNIAAKGGSIVLIYNNGGSFSAIDTGNFTQAVLIQEADGDFLAAQFFAGANITVTFPQTGGALNLPNTATGGLVSSFTSWGPTNDMFMKPAVAAPGGNILSTFPVPLGSFAILSGTSMATPFTAGASALIIEAKGRGIAKQVRNLLQTTAGSIPQTLADGAPPQSLAQQGAGLMNVNNAVTFKTVVTPGELLLNDTAHFKGVQIIQIQNTAKTFQTYKLTHVPAGTVISLTPGTPDVADTVVQTADAATVKIVPSTIIVPPGFTLPVVVSITPPKGVDATTLPVFSGFIQITSATENLHVSYIGVAASLKNAQVVDNTSTFFGIETPVIIDSNGNVQTGLTTYTFQGVDFPTMFLRLTMGTPALLLDLVDQNIVVTTSLRKRSFSDWWPGIFKPLASSSFSKIKTIGPLMEFTFIPRNTDDPTTGFDSIPFTPTFANGTTIPNGTYRILLRVLKITGDPTNEADYEVYLSPPIGIAQ